jgi:2'-5' RNA ligase
MRVFMAIDFDESIKTAVARKQAELKSFGNALRRVRDDQMHLTVKYLGEVDDGRSVELCETVSRIASACRPFELDVGGVGCFPLRGNVRVLWAGLTDADGGLGACYEQSESAFAGIGFPKEGRAFSPHLTMARVNSPVVSTELRRWVAETTLHAGRQPVDHLTLYESHLSSSGAAYSVLTRAAFQLDCAVSTRQGGQDDE